MQGIVYNAHYLTFVDDAFDCWLRSLDQRFEDTLGWEVMLKKAEITWESSAKFADQLEVHCEVGRWGKTSFDTHFEGKVDTQTIFTALVTYVCVDHETYQPILIPSQLNEHLSAPTVEHHKASQ